MGKATGFGYSINRHKGKPALVTVRVAYDRVKSMNGNCKDWHGEHDACYTTCTTHSTKPEWCFRDASMVTVFSIEKLPPNNAGYKEEECCVTDVSTASRWFASETAQMLMQAAMNNNTGALHHL